MADNPDKQSETSTTITEMGRRSAERAALGKNPYGSMIRIVLVVAVFIIVFGSIFYFARG